MNGLLTTSLPAVYMFMGYVFAWESSLCLAQSDSTPVRTGVEQGCYAADHRFECPPFPAPILTDASRCEVSDYPSWLDSESLRLGLLENQGSAGNGAWRPGISPTIGPQSCREDARRRTADPPISTGPPIADCSGYEQPRNPLYCRPWQLAAGVEMLAIRPSFDQNVAMIIDPAPGNRSVPFEYSFGFSPRVSLGWMRKGVGGLSVSYWYFDTVSPRETVTAMSGATPVYLFVYGSGGNLTRNAYADLGETLSTSHGLRLQSFDLEYIDSLDLVGWQLQPSGGIRIAEIEQHLRGDVYGGVTLLESVTNDLLSRGTGPTAALRLNRYIVPSCLGIYGSIRGTLLLCQSEQQIYEMKNAGVDEVIDRVDHHETITALEFGLGLRYCKCWNNGVVTTASVGYEVQSWQDVGGPVDSNSSLGIDGIATSIAIGY